MPARVTLYRSLALAVAYGGDLDGSGEVSEAALDVARREVPDAVSGVLVDRVHAVWQGGGPRAALAFLEDVGGRMTLPRDTLFESARLFMLYCGTGDASVAPRLAALATKPAGGPVSPFEPMLVYGCVARWTEDFDEDERILDVAETEARRQGVLRALFALGLARCDNRILQGRPQEGLAILESLEKAIPIEPLLGPAVMATQANALCQLGRYHEAAARVDAVGMPLMWQVALVLASVRARLALETGDVATAVERYTEVEALVDRLGVRAPLVSPWASGAIAAYAAAQRWDDVERVVRVARRRR